MVGVLVVSVAGAKGGSKGKDSKSPKGTEALLGGDFGDVDENHDQKITKPELVSFLSSIVKEYDVDKDGKAKRAEALTSRAKQRASKAQAKFKKKDANADGFLSSGEASMSDKKFKRLDKNKDGRLSSAEYLEDKKEDEGSKGPGKKFELLDVNHDGVITATEAKAVAAKAFEKADKNKDGAITSAELVAALKR